MHLLLSCTTLSRSSSWLASIVMSTSFEENQTAHAGPTIFKLLWVGWYNYTCRVKLVRHVCVCMSIIKKSHVYIDDWYTKHACRPLQALRTTIDRWCTASAKCSVWFSAAHSSPLSLSELFNACDLLRWQCNAGDHETHTKINHLYLDN